ncbi:winged helix-turn-helix domain-containing protein [Pollutimonas harenae]|uniref:Winged helix-turn-helix domain-containing protein n=1 Tax=Pollutimonas harenae TaxID=657015 RepID=A0A853GVJ7_9BURK|nr:crosslink repair DNA glycosylase YcaQ family protein [Pollutimonas harenae]NYT86341.1 winged helix-turn-helix domain-containing protein [Pollutimonas harenae]TEA69901.1 winged helix-turn-helix domain-containing protein [Pollutimonas harenae]
MPSLKISQQQARRIWLHAQRLDSTAPFGDGATATPAAIQHLGYVQIDTINVIERCHHHILWTRIPAYQRDHLRQAQTTDKTVFEYWTHALSYIPTSDLTFFIGDMRQQRKTPRSWFKDVTEKDLRKIIGRIREHGALSIRDIDDDTLVEKDHAWASRKPSKRILQWAFYIGKLTVSERSGMLKTYELMDRHFQWETPPRKASDKQVIDYLLDRALRSQGLVSLDSICHLNPKQKPLVHKAIETRMRRGELLSVTLADAGKVEHWTTPETLASAPAETEGVHILSPFDPLIIQRKRLKLFFDYDHLFEAYVPKEKRVFGYLGLPVLVDGEIVSVLDLKADRKNGHLVLQKWSKLGKTGQSAHKRMIEEKLHLFEQFQFAS